ncbi:MAG: CHAD domain-containing protein [Planctomycetales bacterium]
MPFRFRRKESVPDGVRRIVREQIDRAIADATSGEFDLHAAVHQVRKRCKKIRAVLRLVRPQFEPTYRFENAWFRDAARGLATFRDAESIIECCASLEKRFADHPESGALAGLRERLVERRYRLTHEEHDLQQRLGEFLQELRGARERVDDWPLGTGGFGGIVAGLQESYRRGRAALRAAYDAPTPENFHEWRKQVKYHWHHVRLLRNIWKRPMRAWENELDELSERLGDDHDLAVLRATLADEGDSLGDESELDAYRSLIDLRSEELRAAARPAGERLFAEPPKALVRRWRTYWRTWRKKGRSAAPAELRAKTNRDAVGRIGGGSAR